VTAGIAESRTCVSDGKISGNEQARLGEAVGVAVDADSVCMQQIHQAVEPAEVEIIWRGSAVMNIPSETKFSRFTHGRASSIRFLWVLIGVVIAP
jgi:hypothetical protein